jgi:hypothetical protein
MALPELDPKELSTMADEFELVRIVRKYLPNLDDLDLAQLAELAGALNQVVGFLSVQEHVLANDPGEQPT